MIKKIINIMFLSCFVVHAQFVEFQDSSSKNRFVGPARSMCKTQTNNSKKHYQKGYDCGNGSISEFLNVNFCTPSLADQQIYIFNDFMYWMGKQVRAGKNLNLSPDTQFSGGGMFMIKLGVSPYLRQLVAPTKKCPPGQTLLAAQLKYNDGNSLTTWSQDALCLAVTDTFAVQVSSDKDTTAPPYVNFSDNAQIKNPTAPDSWSQESGPALPVYEQAASSPRKIRLINLGKNNVSNESV
jgi:hypothetical protein